MKVPEEIEKDKKNLPAYLRAMRFYHFFEEFNISFEEAIKLNELFINSLDVDIVPLDNASEVIKELSEYFRIVIATNGPIKPARKKIAKIGIDKYIENIFCSEDIGYSKPMVEFFDYLFSSINIEREKTILIGDSLTSDIKSGMINGFDTMWYNQKNKNLLDEYQPTYIIKNLHEIKRKLSS